MKKTVKFLSLLMVVCMLLCSCGQGVGELASTIIDNIEENDVVNHVTANAGTANKNEAAPEKGTYNEGVALVKYAGELSEAILSQLNLVSATALYSGSSWYTVELAAGSDTVETVTYLKTLGCFDAVDYDYIMKTDAETEGYEVSGNPFYDSDQKKQHKTQGVTEAWDYLKRQGSNPGGSPDVVVAVIDTGVDYNHLDLRNNIWINSAEIPDNGKDDDGNGYVDDVLGWDFVGNDNDPMDDNGHGTHVAGIVAAENNKDGCVGVAYNCKVMVLKAGNSSGSFNNSDIAEAIQYAYMNGASVINMSFGGANISLAAEEALQNAYNTCVLVAAAGNDGACNNPGCSVCSFVRPNYPAVLPYVIGVMSVNTSGSSVSSFSNYDHYPYNTYEYEVYAVGESVVSTWPGNKYATLNGTSMAAPAVAGIAALLRSYYSDREMYSSKFIQSQIVNTSTDHPYIAQFGGTDGAHSVVDADEALTVIPTPAVYLHDFRIDDNTSISDKNNGNGVVDAGETIRLYISLYNRGGVASNVNVSIDTIRNGDSSLTDPYLTLVNTTMQMSDIGTYSVRTSGEQYFEITVADNCPNEYTTTLNVHYTYQNEYDNNDDTLYHDNGRQMVNFVVNSGYHLPLSIAENTVFTNDRLYIVSSNVTIAAGVTVTFEEGCQIQFCDDREYYTEPEIVVYGTLNIAGTKDNMVTLAPNELYPTSRCGITVQKGGAAYIDHLDSINLEIKDNNYFSPGSNTLNIAHSVITNSHLKVVTNRGIHDRFEGEPNNALGIRMGRIENCYVEYSFGTMMFGKMDSSLIVLKADNATLWCCNSADYSGEDYLGQFTNNIVYTSFNEKDPSSQVKRVLDCMGAGLVSNNVFVSLDNDNPKTFLRIENYETNKTEFVNNTFGEYFRKNADQLFDAFIDENGLPIVDLYGSCSDYSLLYPHATNIEFFNEKGEQITTVGREKITVRVTFNRPMDTTQKTFLTFGTKEPYADYRIDGTWVSDTVWEGNYTLKAQIENGQNYLKVNNACAAEDPTKIVFGEYNLHEFTIDTTQAMSMNLFAIVKENGIELTFAQDDYDTLLGYNIYRAESKDGNYVKLNPAILLPTDETFLDENAEPGKTYWYTYTVVLTDFSESNPAGRVVATAMDTLTPHLYHTPVNQGYENNNLVISCTATDNVAISTVTLYYRTVGDTAWKTLNMAKQSDKYSATIFGSDVTLAGLEYYIVASDGINAINKGSAETPYTVVVKDASTLSRKGDVDGDGVVTAKDALMLMKCLEGSLLLSDDAFQRADLNGDKTLSAAEALLILQYVNGKINSLEM